MKKILHISNYYKPHIGGIEQTCHDIVDACEGKYEQQVICFSEDKNTKKDMIDNTFVTKCGVFKKIMSQSISFNYKKELKALINDFNPDTIIFHFPNPFVAHYLLKLIKKKNINLIVWYHMDIIKQKFIRKFFEGQTKRLLKRASIIISTSPIYPLHSKSLKQFSSKIKIIPSCINENRLKLNDDDIKLSQDIKEKYQDKKIVFGIGRHVAYKGFKYLIEASKYLSEDYVVLIGGSGPLTDELKQQAANDHKIVFLGRLSESELKAYLSSMDIYSFSSITKNEAFGLALAEAMYYGHPAVTFTIPGSGVNFVNINEVTGLEVENKNSKLFADAIMKIGNNLDLQKEYGTNASNRVKELFLFEKFKKEVLDLLK